MSKTMRVRMIIQRELDALLDYSCSIPTRCTIGKVWKRRVNYRDESKGWLMGEYVESNGSGRVGIKWSRIVVLR